MITLTFKKSYSRSKVNDCKVNMQVYRTLCRAVFKTVNDLNASFIKEIKLVSK